MGKSEASRRRYLPQIPSDTQLRDLQLDSRTYRSIAALMKKGEISTPCDLSRLTVREIMLTKNFGKKSLVNLIRSMEQLSQSRVSEISPGGSRVRDLSLPSLLNKFLHSRMATKVRCNDPRMSGILLELLSLANTLGDGAPLNSNVTLQELAAKLAECTIDPSTSTRLAKLISEIRLQLVRLSQMNLETELRDAVAAIFLESRNNVEIVLDEMGGTGNYPKPVREIADDFWITAARVRQVTQRFARRYSHSRAFLPVLERALRVSMLYVPATAEEIEKRIQSGGLSLSRFRIESLAECARRLGYPVPFKMQLPGGIRIVTATGDPQLGHLIMICARRATAMVGIARIEDVQKEMAKTTSCVISPQLLSFLVRTLPNYHDLGSGWFWLRKRHMNRALRTALKVLAVAPRVHVNEMRAAIAKGARKRCLPLPKEVIVRFCESAARCVVEDDFLVTCERVEPSKVLSRVEQIFLDILRTHGPTMRRADLKRLCTARGMKATTFSPSTYQLPILTNYGHGKHRLIGTMD